MTLDTDKLPSYVVEDIAANLGWTKPEYRSLEHTDDQIDIESFKRRIADMTPYTAFESFCTWNGLIGWHGHLIAAIDALRAAEIKEPKKGAAA